MKNPSKAVGPRRKRPRRVSRNGAAATIEDVALRAGVSIKTVSRVINREPAVRDATRQRVTQAVGELNYRPNFSARNLAGARAYLIALLYDNPSDNYVVSVQAGVLPACQKAGYGVLLQPLQFDSPQLLDTVAALLEERRPSGLVLTPPVCDHVPLLDMLDAGGVDYVCIAPADTARARLLVTIDEQRASRDLTEHLIRFGHRRIAFIEGHPAHGASARRLLGFREAMSAAGLPIAADLIQPGEFSFDSGCLAARRLLALSAPPTAIFACNDDMAAGVLHVALEQRIAVPGQLSVVGFDDNPLSRYVFPSLTTVRQPIRAMADGAVQCLVSRFRQRVGANDDPAPQTRFVCELIQRDSVARAP